MKLISLKCRNCSARLKVPERVRYVTCEFCESRLEIDYSKERATARVLRDLKSVVRAVDSGARQVRSAAESLQHEAVMLRHRNSILHAERELTSLENAWGSERKQYCGPTGFPPYLIFEIPMLIFRTAVTAGIGVMKQNGRFYESLAWLAMLLLVIGGLFILRSVIRIRRAIRYRRAYRKFRQRHEVLQWRLDELRAKR